MSHQYLFRLTLFCSLMVTILTQMSFVRTSYTVSPNYAKSVSSLYIFSFNVYNPVIGTMNLRVDFPNNFVLATATSCQVKLGSTVVSGTTCSLDLTTNEVVINNIIISSVFTTIQVQFRTATSKYSATSTLTFSFMNASSSAVITTNPEFIQIENAIMTCSLTSNTTVVGAAAIYTVQFQPNVEIDAGSVVQLQFDPWGPFSRSNFLTTNTTSVCGGQCTINLLPSFGVQLLVFSSLYASATNNSNTITLNSARNPASFAPIKLKIVISASDGSSVYMTGSTTIAASTTNTFNGVTFDLPVKTISSINSNVGLRVTLRNPLNSNTFLRVTGASQISFSYGYAFNSLSTVPTEITGQPSGQLLLGNLARSTITSEPTILSLGNFTVINPPYSQKSVSLTFRTEQLINSTYYFIDETTIQVAATASTITQSEVRPQILNIGSVTSYDLWFVSVNRLISGSYVIITFPAQTSINIASSTCSLTTSGILSACLIASSTSIRINLNSIANAATNLTFTINSVTNPFLTSPTSSFTIRTYYSDELSLVDQLTAGMIITATEVPLRAVVVTPGSLMVNSKTSYTFNIQTSYDIPISSIVKVYFPAQLTDGAQTLSSFSIDGTPVSGCLLSLSNSSYMEFSNLCIKSVVRNTSTTSIVLNNVLNPSSFKPTSSFTIQIFNGIYRQEYLNTGIIVTMTQTAAIPYFKVTPSSSIVNENNQYTFEINFQIKRFSGDRVLIKFPTDVALSTTFDCFSLTINMTISCSKVSSQTLMFVLNFISSIYPGQSIKFTVQNFTNMWYTATRTFSVQTTANDTTFFYQEEGSTVVSYQPAKIGATINNDNNIVLLGDSKITVSLVSPFVLNKATNASQLYIVLQVPTDFVPKSGTCVPSYGSSTCAQPTTQIFNITGINDFSSTLNIKFTATTSFFQASSAFDIKLYYGPFLVQSNTDLKGSRYCQAPCKQCTDIKIECLSCLPFPKVAQIIYFSFNSSCVTTCPDKYYLISSSLSCGKCSSTECYNCVNSATQCTSCPASKYLYNKTCLSVCPDGFYAFNAQCLACSNPCATCAGQATTCLSCVSSFFIDFGTNSSKCVRTCTNTAYLGIDSQCKLCTSNCKTCSVALNNCTSCDQTQYYFYLNSCIRNCPVGMYNNPNGICTLCESPCQTCTTRVNCQTCAINFYLFNVTSCLARCPSGYVQSISSCIPCNAKCTACSITSTNCTSCPTETYFYQNSCLNNCPVGMYNNATGICSTCQSPCLTCTTNLNCLTCSTGFFMFNGTGCVTSCPNGYVGQISSCISCDIKCKTCSVTTSNCTSCPTGTFFYQNDCLANCPTGMYNGANGVCTTCESPCKTCITRLNCLSCLNNYYMFNGTSCVTQCPNGFIQQVNNCVSCAQKCATCSVTAGNCTSCPSGSYFYQNDCYTTCPALTYPYNKTCTRCITPCVTCASSPQVCLTCIQGLILLNSTCVTTCPLSSYIEQDKKCLQCPSNCVTCQTSINCSLCSNDFYLLQGGCVSLCPINYPIITNRQCQACNDVCLTCSTSKQNCTSCKINLFKHSYTCVESCPIGYYSNIMTYECQDGLSTKIVFFPILIMSIIIFVFVCIVKCIVPDTSLPTSLTSILSLTEMAIWIFMIIQLTQPFKELNVDYTLPIITNVVALGCLIVQNVVFFFLELKKMQQDDFVRGWAINNVNYSVLTIHRYVGLVLNFKFFRFCYSRFFNIRTLSLPFRSIDNIFPLTTVFSILNFILCQVPMMICSFSLAYKKLIKDQLFYTSIECLILTATCAVILLIDIFKSEDYFEDCDYVKTRKYLEKIKDASFNQLEDHFDITHNEGSVQGEKYVSRTGGKFVFSKQEVAGNSLKQLYFQEEAGSVMTDAMQTLTGKGDGNKANQKRKKKINIFDPIKQEDEQLYEDLKYEEQQIKTQVQIESQKQKQMNQHKEEDHAISYSDIKQRRLMQLGVNTEQQNWDDDNRSMIQQRPLKQKWNNIIGHRKRLARSIFNTMDEFSSKELQKIIEPIDEEDYQQDDEHNHYQYNNSSRQRIEDPFRTTDYGKVKKSKRRKRKLQNQQPGNSELEKIYLQRLTEKKKYKDIFASSQSIKYDF